MLNEQVELSDLFFLMKLIPFFFCRSDLNEPFVCHLHFSFHCNILRFVETALHSIVVDVFFVVCLWDRLPLCTFDAHILVCTWSMTVRSTCFLHKWACTQFGKLLSISYDLLNNRVIELIFFLFLDWIHGQQWEHFIDQFWY